MLASKQTLIINHIVIDLTGARTAIHVYTNLLQLDDV